MPGKRSLLRHRLSRPCRLRRGRGRRRAVRLRSASAESRSRASPTRSLNVVKCHQLPRCEEVAPMSSCRSCRRRKSEGLSGRTRHPASMSASADCSNRFMFCGWRQGRLGLVFLRRRSPSASAPSVRPCLPRGCTRSRSGRFDIRQRKLPRLPAFVPAFASAGGLPTFTVKRVAVPCRSPAGRRLPSPPCCSG